MGAAVAGVIWTLTAIAWLSALFLVRVAHGAHIGALTERAVAAVGIALFGAIFSVVVWNTEVGQVLAPGVIQTIVRAAVVILLLVPAYWTVLYLAGRLGDDGQGGGKQR